MSWLLLHDHYGFDQIILYWLNWGIAIAARMPMIAITISSSMSVKPDAFLQVESFCMTISLSSRMQPFSS